ncbi:unnamed protein product [Gadus morhua 'NCC']
MAWYLGNDTVMNPTGQVHVLYHRNHKQKAVPDKPSARYAKCQPTAITILAPRPNANQMSPTTATSTSTSSTSSTTTTSTNTTTSYLEGYQSDMTEGITGRSSSGGLEENITRPHLRSLQSRGGSRQPTVTKNNHAPTCTRRAADPRPQPRGSSSGPRRLVGVHVPAISPVIAAIIAAPTLLQMVMKSFLSLCWKFLVVLVHSRNRTLCARYTGLVGKHGALLLR